MNHLIHELLIWGDVVAGLVAAFLWYRSTIVYVPSIGTSGFGALVGGFLVVPGPKNGTRADLIGTLQKQSKMNKYAAIVTAFSVGLQALMPLFPSQ